MRTLDATSLVLALALAPLWGCKSTAQRDTPWVLGVLSPLSGDFTDFARVMEDGISTAVHAINTRGGIRGRTVVTVVENSNTSYATRFEAIPAAEKLLAQGAFAIMGPATGFQLNVLRLWSYERGVFVGSATAIPNNEGPNNMSIAMASTDVLLYEIVARDMIEEGHAHVVVVGPTSSEGTSAPMGRMLQSLDPNSTYEVIFYPTQSDYTGFDMTPTVDAVLARVPDAVYVDAYNNTDAGLLIESLKAKGFTGTVYLGQSVIGVPENIGAQDAQGLRQVSTGIGTEGLPAYNSFAAEYKAWSGRNLATADFALRPLYDMALYTLLAMVRAGDAGNAGGPPLMEAFHQVIDPNGLEIPDANLDNALMAVEAGRNINFPAAGADLRLNSGNESLPNYYVTACCNPNGDFDVKKSYDPTLL